MSTKELQLKLTKLGYDVGPTGADGVFGRNTIAAVKKFQADYKITVKTPGSVGPLTLAMIEAALAARTPLAVSLSLQLLSWMDEAERLKGIRETPGAKSNATILGWAKKLGGWVASFYTEDSIPWCGLFVAHCVGATLPGEALPNNPLGALNWKTFGIPCETPTRGAVLVFTRTGGGHVGFYAGEDDEAYHVLGGNQSDQVNVTRVAKSRCVAVRWPKTAPAPNAGRTLLTRSGALSTNEA